VAERRVNERIVEKMKSLGLMWRLSRFFDRDNE
jgi:hypothetical protein